MDPRLRAHLAADEPSDAAFVDAVFALALRRDVDDEARERALRKLTEGTLSRAALLHELVTSDEVTRVRLLDDAIAFARGARERAQRPPLHEDPSSTHR